MIGLTIKHLRYFDALARHGHFGRAAEACAISQPALSLQIKDLESMLGAPLVERATRQIRMTTLGEEFLSRARKILIEVDELGALARTDEGPFKGLLRLGVIPTVAPYLLPAIIRELADRFPDLELQPREAVTKSLIEDLQQSRLDLVIAALPISEPTLREFALFEEDFVLVRGVRDAGKPVPSPEKLQAMKLLLLEEGHCFRDQALSFCDIRPTDPRYLMGGSSLSTLVQMVSAGLGVTLIPDMALPLETHSASVSVCRFPGEPPKRTIGMVWRKTNPLGNQLMQLGAVIRQIGQAQRDKIIE
ncbi:MAG: hydrogen peroxide-inducible genes activator [Stappiaceae bacterium]